MTTVWQPIEATHQDVVTSAAASALHDLLDRDGDPPDAGSPLPLLWHWLAFLPQARQSDLGEDGHPRTGSFLPPADGRSRMYAGGRIAIGSAPVVGEPLTRTSRVSDVARKKGRTGDLMFVTVDHEFTSGRAVIHERQNLVYRDARRFEAREAPEPREDAHVWAWGRDVRIEPTLLFRFSALTYNAHRIHYDRDYATGAEGYPALVVHGPLQAVLLADAVARVFPGRAVRSFEFRALAPAFDDHDLQLRLKGPSLDEAPEGTPTDGDTIELAAFSGRVKTMTAAAVLEPTPTGETFTVF
jgi:3-methylfumaryl-CoA hydratase